MTKPMTPNKTPAVSVLMLSHGRGGYLKQAIESIVAQTFTDWELIIVDDTEDMDDRADVADVLAVCLDQLPTRRQGQIKVVRVEPGTSLARKRNVSLSLARGPIVVQADDDDISLPHRLAVTVQAFKDDPTLIALTGDAAHIDRWGNLMPDSQAWRGSLNYHHGRPRVTHWSGGGFACRTDAMFQVGAYRWDWLENGPGSLASGQRRGSDWDLYSRLHGYYGQKCFRILDDFMTMVRIHDHGQVTTTNWDNQNMPAVPDQVEHPAQPRPYPKEIQDQVPLEVCPDGTPVWDEDQRGAWREFMDDQGNPLTTKEGG